MAIKIMHYNVLHGFHSGGLGEKVILPFKFQPERLEFAKKVIKSENPDILVINEACFVRPFFEKSTGRTLFLDYQKEFRFPYHYPINTHHEWGVSLLSRFPFESAEDYSQHHRTFIKYRFIYHKKEIHLDIAHPHPDLTEEDKRKFFRNCLRNIKTPYILVGDFNSLSNEDSYDQHLLINGFSRFMGRAAKPKIMDLLKRKAIEEIKNHNLVDTFITSKKKWAYTIPTDYLSKSKDSGIRIDYIFCSPDFKVINSEIIRNKDTNKASDHYPVIAQLELKSS